MAAFSLAIGSTVVVTGVPPMVGPAAYSSDAPLLRMAVSKRGGVSPSRGSVESGEDRKGGLPPSREVLALGAWFAATVSSTAEASSSLVSSVPWISESDSFKSPVLGAALSLSSQFGVQSVKLTCHSVVRGRSDGMPRSGEGWATG